MAKLYFRYGAMNSGKTALLLQASYNYEERGMKTFVMKPSVDTKGDNYLISRIGLKRKVDHKIKPDEKLYEYLKSNLNEISCVFVDEAQFLKKKQVDDLLKIVIEFNIPIICYGLRTDFKTEGFEGATRLLQIASSIEEMKTICRCGRKAVFNIRKVNGKVSFSGEQIKIDNQEKISYESFCPTCYYKEYKGR